jgi:hypothetical protein
VRKSERRNNCPAPHIPFLPTFFSKTRTLGILQPNKGSFVVVQQSAPSAASSPSLFSIPPCCPPPDRGGGGVETNGRQTNRLPFKMPLPLLPACLDNGRAPRRLDAGLDCRRARALARNRRACCLRKLNDTQQGIGKCDDLWRLFSSFGAPRQTPQARLFGCQEQFVTGGGQVATAAVARMRPWTGPCQPKGLGGRQKVKFGL